MELERQDPDPELLPLTLALHHAGLQVVAVALQRVARLLQAADDGLRGASAVAVVHGAGGGAGARRVPGRGAGRVARGGAEAAGGQVEGRVHGLLLVLQAVSVQLLVAQGAAPQRVAGGTRAPPGRRGGVLLPQTCSREARSSTPVPLPGQAGHRQPGSYFLPACAPGSEHR